MPNVQCCNSLISQCIEFDSKAVAWICRWLCWSCARKKQQPNEKKREENLKWRKVNYIHLLFIRVRVACEWWLRWQQRPRWLQSSVFFVKVAWKQVCWFRFRFAVFALFILSLSVCVYLVEVRKRNLLYNYVCFFYISFLSNDLLDNLNLKLVDSIKLLVLPCDLMIIVEIVLSKYTWNGLIHSIVYH